MVEGLTEFLILFVGVTVLDSVLLVFGLCSAYLFEIMKWTMA